jgi:hypothetical protein
MVLPTGTISMANVNVELARSSTATISLNESAVRGLAGIASGTISMNDLRGKSAGTPTISNKSSTANGLAYDSGQSSASIIHYFYSNRTYLIEGSAEGFPDNSSYSVGDLGFQTDWLSGGSASDYSMKYTYTGNAPVAQIGSTTGASVNTWYGMTDNSGTAALFSLTSIQSSGVGTTSKSATVTISIARTSDTSTVLDTATLTMTATASVNDNPLPD